MVDSFPVHALTSLAAQMEQAKDAGKYLFIRDLNGNVSVFAQYQHMLNDFFKEVMKTKIN